MNPLLQLLMLMHMSGQGGVGGGKAPFGDINSLIKQLFGNNASQFGGGMTGQAGGSPSLGGGLLTPGAQPNASNLPPLMRALSLGFGMH
jgi:hypothetical protein